MRRDVIFRHEFVECLPQDLQEGTVYVSLAYTTAAHLCCCGCGREVVTPLSPTDWKLVFDGESVSLYPSIGNWSFPCQSHYWIRENRVHWARRWSQEEVETGRTFDVLAKQAYFSGDNEGINRPETPLDEVPEKRNDGLWRRLKGWLYRGR